METLDHNNTQETDSTKITDRAITDECRDITLPYLCDLMKETMNDVNAVFLELAEKAENNQLQTAYFDAMKAVDPARTKVEEAFKQQLSDAFDELWQRKEEVNVAELDFDELFDADSLMLLEDADLEESVAVANMVFRAQSNSARNLFALERRFEKLVPECAIRPDLVPLGPRRICKAFRESMTHIDIEVYLKIVIYRLFDRHVIAKLDPLYSQVNALLIEHNILPKIRLTVKTEPEDYAKARA